MYNITTGTMQLCTSPSVSVERCAPAPAVSSMLPQVDIIGHAVATVANVPDVASPVV